MKGIQAIVLVRVWIRTIIARSWDTSRYLMQDTMCRKFISFGIGMGCAQRPHGKKIMRKQYHFRPSPKGYYAWDVGKLIKLAEPLPTLLIELEKIKELNESYWYGESIPSVRSVAEHARLISECDLEFPIILSSDGRVMDGMHRVAKAWMQQEKFIRAKQFSVDPLPDFKDIHPDDLDYTDD